MQVIVTLLVDAFLLYTVLFAFTAAWEYFKDHDLYPGPSEFNFGYCAAVGALIWSYLALMIVWAPLFVIAALVTMGYLFFSWRQHPLREAMILQGRVQELLRHTRFLTTDEFVAAVAEAFDRAADTGETARPIEPIRELMLRIVRELYERERLPATVVLPPLSPFQLRVGRQYLHDTYAHAHS